MGGEVPVRVGQRHESVVCVCAECKKVIQIVGEVTSGSAPVISHGICPACAQILYGHLFRKPAEH